LLLHANGRHDEWRRRDRQGASDQTEAHGAGFIADGERQ
jgi:hypothetical protein